MPDFHNWAEVTATRLVTMPDYPFGFMLELENKKNTITKTKVNFHMVQGVLVVAVLMQI